MRPRSALAGFDSRRACLTLGGSRLPKSDARAHSADAAGSHRVPMSTNDADRDISPGTTDRCEHCNAARSQWQTDRYATHLTRCPGISDAGQSTLDEVRDR